MTVTDCYCHFSISIFYTVLEILAMWLCIFVINMRLFCSFAIIVIKLYIFNTNLIKRSFSYYNYFWF